MARNIPDRTELEADVVDLVHHLARTLRRSARDVLDPLGVTWAQVRALRTIVAGPPPLRMGILAERLDVVPRSATSVVDELEDKGLATRTRDPADRRAVAVEATDAGWALLARLGDQRRDVASQVLAELTDADLDALRALLGRTGTC